MEFTYTGYRHLIELARLKGYLFSFYQEVEQYDKSIILRHDVDFSPIKALEMAKIEHELGVKSTYFILLATEFYNVFSVKTSEIFTEILSLGHQIGLHYDEQKYQTTSREVVKQVITKEVRILEEALKIKIDVVSMHRPSEFVLNASIELDDLINAYGNKYLREMKYVSDSRMYWRENIIEIIEKCEHKKIHLVTHPFWYSDQNEATKDKLKLFINQGKVERFEQIDKNFRNLDEFLKMDEIE
ncbi:MAG TPA: hypothetical protein DIC19_05765 [Erysipelotrichaceae bacterium]|nr:hypothetical protein [Erysipelotrichaceae bacterium]